jgi:hypothetical protein
MGRWLEVDEGETNLASGFSHILGRTMRMHILTCENIMVGPKGLMMRSLTWGDEFLGHAKTSLDWHKGRDNAIPYLCWCRSSHWARMHRLALRESLGGPRQLISCHAKMSRLARRNTLGGPKQVVRRWSKDERTCPILGKLLDPLTEWLNEFFEKKPLVLRWNLR